MQPEPTPTPAQHFAAILRGLTHAVITRAFFGLPQPLINLIVGRIREISQGFARLAARAAAGRAAPRRSTPRRTGAARPRRRNPLPQSVGWLVPLVPEAVVFRSQLEYLLRDPAMAALLAAAPASLRRPVRSLCRMLGAPPPAILAIPRRTQPRRTEPGRAATPAPAVAPPTPPAVPARPAPTSVPPARACGPPHPA